VLSGSRAALARAITLAESRLPQHRRQAAQLLQEVSAGPGPAFRLGITGPPGVGKSTLVEALGLHAIELGQSVAVLAVDPTSPLSGGSLLGDKTRMERLAAHPRAYIRPSPSGDHPGGVARATRAAMALCEAAGYSCVMVETVGVGQTEVEVSWLVDATLLLVQCGAGDELQGLKRGAIELADVVAVPRCDGERQGMAREAALNVRSALKMLAPAVPGWRTPVQTCSSLTGEGIPELWARLLAFRRHLEETGSLVRRRRLQAARWFTRCIDDRLRDDFYARAGMEQRMERLKVEVVEGRLTPELAVEELFSS
ncbi:MAG: methylmalonyl Co-A mutase-associated GTPase MeaB, partial [Candidatus Eremiobacterota bacterium]